MSKHLAIIAALAGTLLSCSPSFAGNADAPRFAGPPTPPAAHAALQATPVEAADMAFMREEEKLARDVYLNLYDLWGIAPFAIIANSEQHHMDAVLRLLTRYRLPDPAAGKLIGEFSDAQLQALFDSLMVQGSASAAAALGVGALIEEVDLEDLAAAIARSSRTDIHQVYERLSCGSRNHLRAFARALEALTGQPYVAQVLPPAVVESILAAQGERCGTH